MHVHIHALVRRNETVKDVDAFLCRLPVLAQVDPMEPPKHKHKKVPRAPADDPVPVLHSPPRKVSHVDLRQGEADRCLGSDGKPAVFAVKTFFRFSFFC